MSDNDQLKVDLEPRKVVVTSEAYVRYSRFGYQPAIDVREAKTRRDYFLYISAKSLADPLETLRNENGGKFVGLEFWIWKKGTERRAPYMVED